MTVLRTILGGVLLAPFFVLAQTTTTALTQEQQQLQYEQQLNDLLKRQQELFVPNSAEISAQNLLKYLEVKTSPQNPGPNETIRITVESYISNLDKAYIVWSLNGKTVLSGTGKRAFSFTNGLSGKTTYLTIYITTSGGENITKELSWSPVGLTLFWEASTYTPPFYRGKALLSPQATVRVTALPDNPTGGNALSAGNLTYVWKKDGTIATAASGYGQNSFTFPGPKPYGKANVKVLVSSMDDTFKSEKRVDLSLSQPFILFYETTPLLGTWYNRPVVANFTLTKKELTLSAEPFFFSNEDADRPTLQYDWLLNGRPVQNSGRMITLRNDTGARGASSLSLSMSGIKRTFQSASQSIRINFADNESTAPAPSF